MQAARPSNQTTTAAENDMLLQHQHKPQPSAPHASTPLHPTTLLKGPALHSSWLEAAAAAAAAGAAAALRPLPPAATLRSTLSTVRGACSAAACAASTASRLRCRRQSISSSLALQDIKYISDNSGLLSVLATHALVLPTQVSLAVGQLLSRPC
jgi:hypothetical protein